MKQIHSKDIYYVLRDILKIMDPKIMNHGTRTSFILYKMLEVTGKYEKFEEAEFGMLATFHDIGAYRTNRGDDVLTYESKDVHPHSVYGYLALLYLCPFKDRAKVVLYHHTDYDKVPKDGYDYLEIVHCLNVAEKMDMYFNILGEKFDYKMFEKQAGTKFSPRALMLLYTAQSRYDIFGKLASGEYIQELNELYENLIFTNEEKRDYVLGLMYSIGFRSEYTVVDVATCVNICDEMCDVLYINGDDREKLFLAAVLHDLGMVAVPSEDINSPLKRPEEEREVIIEHIANAEKVLRGRVSDEVLEIILNHHERCDGSGYPRHLRDLQMNDLQKLLQLADVVTTLYNPRSYSNKMSKEEIIDYLNEMATFGRLSKPLVRLFEKNYDKIMAKVDAKSKEMMDLYAKLHDSYEETLQQSIQGDFQVNNIESE